MAMNHVDILERRHPLEIDVQRLQDFLKAFVSRIAIQLLAKANRADVVRIIVLRAKAACFDVAELGKFLAEKFDVDSCTAVNFWRKLVSKNSSVHYSVNSG